MPRAIVLILETVLAMPKVCRLADVATAVLQARSVYEHIPPGIVRIGCFAAVDAPNSSANQSPYLRISAADVKPPANGRA